MTLIPQSVKVHLAFGFIDMRKASTGLPCWSRAGLASPSLLAHVLVAKYCDHLPLYREPNVRTARRRDRPLDPGELGRRRCWWLEPLQARLADSSG
jgi:transposase